MRFDELPQFLRDLAHQHGKFDPVLIMYGKVFRSGYLHFGYWPDDRLKDVDLEGLLNDARAAQIRYADELLALIPEGPQRVLDVGAGLGRLAGEMASRGHSVTAVTPDAYQVEHISRTYPAVAVRHGRFQDIGASLTPAAFDVILFSESFRYMPLDDVFPLLDRLLSKTGRVLIADWFVSDTARTKPGHDHKHTVFLEKARRSGFAIASERDVTANVRPTVKMGYDVLCELYLPLAAFLAAKIAQKYPRLFRLGLPRFVKWFERKILPQLPGRSDPQEFAAHYRYVFCTLQRGDR